MSSSPGIQSTDSGITEQINDIHRRVKSIQRMIFFGQLWTGLQVLVFALAILGSVVYLRPFISMVNQYIGGLSQFRGILEQGGVGNKGIR